VSQLKLVSDWIRSRQSIYPASFTGEVISDEIITTLLENANAAPSHRHTEPWRFHVISNSKIEDFATFAQEQYKQHFSDADFKQRKYDKIKKKLAVTSHLILIGMQRDMKERVPEWEEISAVSCAVQNIYLSMSAAGVGGYWSSPGYLMERAGAFIDLAAGERCLGLLYLGIPTSELPPAIIKRPTKEKTKWYK